jgi:hypothetical protein
MKWSWRTSSVLNARVHRAISAMSFAAERSRDRSFSMEARTSVRDSATIAGGTWPFQSPNHAVRASAASEDAFAGRGLGFAPVTTRFAFLAARALARSWARLGRVQNARGCGWSAGTCPDGNTGGRGLESGVFPGKWVPA